MLVLRRKPGERIVISGGITIGIEEVVGRRVKVSIIAPPGVDIVRGEIAERGYKREQISQYQN